MKTKYLIKKILRKIYHFIGFMTIFMFCLLPVKADTTNYIFDITRNNYYSNFDFTNVYNKINNDNYEYYAIIFNNTSSGNYLNNYLLFQWNSADVDFDYFFSVDGEFYSIVDSSNRNFHRTFYLNNVGDSGDTVNQFPLFATGGYLLYDSNYDFESEYNLVFRGFYNDNITINVGDNMPLYKDLLLYNSWSAYENNHLEGYTEVNLNNYDYVLLSLKNYNQSNAFESNLQVKGQIGITPIYNYGQTSKDSVTGVQVQDRCNSSYSDYTSYPLYILQSDLQNNVVYAVKSCANNSSFKFDSNVFDITYVTQENASDPIVTINGQQYHTIPYSDLPSTATKNESDNYIPGESYNFVDSGIDSLNSALKQSSNWLSSIWSTITYFTQFIGLIFASLPSELHAILISAFTITIIIGLIKHFTS